MKEITLEAKVDNLNTVLSAVDEELEKADCTMMAQMAIDVAVEEIFVNIASYAYGDATGDATIIIDVDAGSSMATITFIDSGTPYNPLEKPDPDMALSMKERGAGGMGIYLAKSIMDEMEYEYVDSCNHLTMRRRYVIKKE